MDMITSEVEATEEARPVRPKHRAWLKQLLSPGETLSQRVVRGGFWVFALRVADRLFRLARTIVLARLLAPEDFGLFGIALLAMSALGTFSQTGFQQALIQKKKDIEPYLDTTWTVQAIRGVVLALILFGVGPYVAAFFGEPAAAPLLRVLGLSMLFQGFTNIGVVYFQKELEFHKQFVYQMTGTIVDFGVAVAAALLLQNAWALIFGLLARSFVQVAMSYVIHPYRPRVRFEGAKARELYKFGRWIFGSTIIVFLLTQGDGIFVGKVLGVTALGLYQMAYRISNLPATEITHVISQVSFPAYAKLQDNIDKIRKAYLEALQLTVFISVPLAAGIFSLAPEFTRLFLGEKWMPMVPAMQILAFWGLLRALAALTGPLFQGIGKPDIGTKLQLAKLPIIAVLIYPFTIHWGILGTSLTIVISAVLINPLYLYWAARIVKCPRSAYVKVIGLPATAALLMSLVITLSKSYVFSSVDFRHFVLLVVSGVSLYTVLILILDKITGYDLVQTMRERFSLRY